MRHFSGHLREAFIDWINAGCPPIVFLDDGEQYSWDHDFLDLMTDCGDVVPGVYCEMVGVERGTTYAQLAAHLAPQNA